MSQLIDRLVIRTVLACVPAAVWAAGINLGLIGGVA